MSKENVEAKKPELLAIQENGIKPPGQKIKKTIQGEQYLYYWSLDDEKALVGVQEASEE